MPGFALFLLVVVHECNRGAFLWIFAHHRRRRRDGTEVDDSDSEGSYESYSSYTDSEEDDGRASERKAQVEQVATASGVLQGLKLKLERIKVRYGDPPPQELMQPLETAIATCRTAETLQTMATRDSKETTIAAQYVSQIYAKITSSELPEKPTVYSFAGFWSPSPKPSRPSICWWKQMQSIRKSLLVKFRNRCVLL